MEEPPWNYWCEFMEVHGVALWSFIKACILLNMVQGCKVVKLHSTTWQKFCCCTLKLVETVII